MPKNIVYGSFDLQNKQKMYGRVSLFIFFLQNLNIFTIYRGISMQCLQSAVII